MDEDVQFNGKFTFYFSTTRGVIGSTQCKETEKAKYCFDKNGSQPAEITSMIWGKRCDEILYGNLDGYVKSYDVEKDTIVDLLQSDGDGKIVGLGVKNTTIVSGRKSGDVTLTCDDDVKSTFRVTENRDDSTLECLRHNVNRGNVVATGGEFNDLKLWDVDTRTIIFKAKSMGHDELNLPLRTSIRDISFFNDEDKLTCCCTKEGQLLLYDERAQRRPICKYVETKASYTCLTTTYREMKCLVGTTRGYVQLIDLRQPTKLLKTFKSFTGSVTSLVCDPILPIVASTSIDRHLRVHNLETKELLYKEYAKQSLTQLLMKPIVKDEDQSNSKINDTENVDETEVIDEEYDELFDRMQVIKDDKDDDEMVMKIRKRKLQRKGKEKVFKVKKKSC